MTAQRTITAPALTTPAPRRRFALPTRHPIYPILALLAALVALARCWTIASVYNHTTDELAHIAGAVGLVESGRNIYMVEHPTLPRLIVGLALKIRGVEYPPARQLKEVQPRLDANAAGADILFRGKIPYWQTLATARRASLVFLAVLLFYTYLLARYLANPLAAMLTTVFLTFDANILAHAALVTTDIPAAAGFVAATYYALRFVARPTWPRTILAAIALGLAMSCKFTCILLAPAILVLIFIRTIRNRAHFPRLTPLAAIPFITFVTLWATYLFNVGKLDDQRLFDEEKAWNRIPQWVKQTPLPMPSMYLGVMFMGAIGKTGFPCYFNGQLDLTGHLGYFPEALAIKSPTGLVLAVAIALLALLLPKKRRPILLLCILLPPSLLLLTAMTGKLQIGIRHILPIIPFVYLFSGFYLHRGAWQWPLLALMLVSAIETAKVHPDYLPFFNTLAGGPTNGAKYLADSNLDWGQDVARLADYLKSNHRTDYTIKVSGVRVAELIAFLGLDPASRDRDVEQLEAHPHGLLCLGVNAKLGVEDFKKDKDGTIHRGPDYSWVNRHPMVARIGYSIEVYDLDK